MRFSMNDEISPELVLQAYRLGIFPMADQDGTLYWYSPDPRCVLDLDRFHLPRSLRQVIRRGLFEIRFDAAFEEVMRACADREEGTWISEDIIRVYVDLHRRGFAHSVESWRDGRLAGGLYGLAIGGAFFGESMFYRESNASKAALAALVERLRERGFTLLDIQWSTPHLEHYGADEIPRGEYLARLDRALRQRCRLTDAGK
jgi:leucyl/phenylalanyl-tRNA---protein transferase